MVQPQISGPLFDPRHAFEVPNTSGVRFHSLLTVSLNNRGSITHVINDTGATTPAGSAPSFDGVWSVVIITDKGACDRAYRYPIRIRNGAMLAEGSSPATINGKVASNGQVTVTVSAGTIAFRSA